MRKLRFLLLASFLMAASVAYARPRSGASFGGLRGFRASPSRGFGSGSYSRGYSGSRNNYGRGSSFVFLPTFGWGWGGCGYGGGMSLFGTLLVVGVVSLSAIMMARSIRRAARRGMLTHGASQAESDELAAASDRCYVYKVQLGVGRSGRGIQKRLEEFASTGDTSTEAGLADLLRQTALELMREKDSIRYGLVEPSGPFTLMNGETKLNGAAMAERSRFQVERVRSAGGQVRRSDAAASAASGVLEYIVVTVLVATRQAFSGLSKLDDAAGLDGVLAELGSVPATEIRGLEVIWTPADPDDSLTQTDVMTTYPEMRSL
jgi:uncharacterized membrane protein